MLVDLCSFLFVVVEGFYCVGFSWLHFGLRSFVVWVV